MMLRHTRNTIIENTPAEETKSQDTEIKKFAFFYDDSSDEDEINQKNTRYDIVKEWKSLSTKMEMNNKNKEILNNDEMLSFVAHAAGLKLIYSNKINQRYYPLKRELLSEKKGQENAIDRLDKLIKAGLSTSINHSLSKVSDFLTHSGANKSTLEKWDDECKQIKSDVDSNCEKIISKYMANFINWLKLLRFTQDPAQPQAIIQFQQEISNLFFECFYKHTHFNKDTSNRDELKSDLSQLAIEKFNALAKTFSFHRLDKSHGKTLALKKLEGSTDPFQNTIQFLTKILEASPARGYVFNMASKELEDKDTEKNFIRAYLDDLMQINSSKNKTLSSTESMAIKKFLTITQESVFDELSQDFNKRLPFELQNQLSKFRRPTLDKTHRFVSKNPYSFHTHLRLANRSQQRLITNLKDPIFKKSEFVSSRAWQLNGSLIENTDVLETQVILKTSLGRKDKVEDAGNYETVYEEIEQIKKFFHAQEEKVTDKIIANWLRETFKGKILDFDVDIAEQSQIIQKLNTINYLIFGCESSRNPAMHVINQMILDLIIANDEWSFEEIFTGKNSGIIAENPKRMPMAPEGAVAVARALESEYRDFMPQAYFYRGIEDKDNGSSTFSKRELIQLEGRVLRHWLQLTKFNIKKSEKQEAPMLVLEHIEKHFENWLGVAPVKELVIPAKAGI